jgi:hypothetical protein
VDGAIGLPTTSSLRPCWDKTVAYLESRSYKVFIPTVEGDLLKVAHVIRLSQEHNGTEVTVRARTGDGKDFVLGEPEEGRLQYGLARMRELLEKAGG